MIVILAKWSGIYLTDRSTKFNNKRFQNIYYQHQSSTSVIRHQSQYSLKTRPRPRLDTPDINTK